MSELKQMVGPIAIKARGRDAEDAAREFGQIVTQVLARYKGESVGSLKVSRWNDGTAHFQDADVFVLLPNE